MAGFSQKAISKLASSGLSPSDAKALGIVYQTAARTEKDFPSQPVESIRFVYHTIEGVPRADVWRVRLLGTTKNAFGVEPTKPVRYLQPPDSPPAVYFPRTVDWARIADDPGEPLHITEGELKAACACKHGFQTIGLGGVWSWRSVRDGVGLLPDLEAIKWAGRDVVLLFDTDAATNPQVSAALAKLVGVLSQRGAIPRVVQLEPVNGDPKTGLDDYIVAKGPDALDVLITNAPADDLAKKLWEFNAQFSFVLSPGMVYDDNRKVSYDPNAFKGSLFANVWADRVITRYDVKGNPTDRIEKVQVAKEWLQWPIRKQYDKLTYEPGRPKVVDGRLNEWPGWGCVSKKGTVKPWTKLLDTLFDGAEPGARRWFEQWCLYPFWRPGIKMLAAVGMWSRVQGVGKSLIGVTLGRVYGRDNYSTISQQELDSGFNTWAAKRQFVMVDDISGHDSRSKADILKKLITQETLLVNTKYIPTYELQDHVNYYLTSNRANAFFVEDHDRRFFIHEITAPKAPPAFFDDYHKWLAGEGPAALFWYAVNKMDFEGFNPFAPPPSTQSKIEMVDATRGELDLWLSELAFDPDSKLRVGATPLKRDLYTVSEVLEMFERVRKGRPVASNTMGLRMREYFEPVPGRVLRIDGVTERFFIIRNKKQWTKAKKERMVEHVKKTRGEGRGKKDDFVF